MDLATQIEKVRSARKLGARHIAMSDAQPIFVEAYGESENWPSPDTDPDAYGQFHVEDVEKAISVVKKSIHRQAKALESAGETVIEDERESGDEDDGESFDPNRLETAPIPESAKASLRSSGFTAIDEVNRYLDEGGSLTDFNRIGESTARRIERYLGRDEDQVQAEPQPAV